MANRWMCAVVLGMVGASLPATSVTASAAEGNCLIHPYVVITVTTPVGGILETVAVDRGDPVKEGQIVATLDTSVERATGAVAHAQAELSNRRLADLELQRTTAEVNMRTIRSPINGVVVERFMSPGEYPKQEKILKLAQLHPLRVEAYVPISMLGKITVGMEAQIKPEDPVGGNHKAKVTVVDHVVDAGSGTLGIRMELPNPDLRIPAGLKCTVRFAQKPEKNGSATDSTTINKDR